MRSTHLLMFAAAVACMTWAGTARAQGNGLSTAVIPVWSQWQGRLTLGLSQWPPADTLAGHAPQLSSLSLLGDYYFYRHAAGGLNRSTIGGFRATSGVLLGNASPRLLSGWSGGSLTPGRFSLSRQSLGLDTPLAAAGNGGRDEDAAPYIGLGYTSISLSGGWGFSADIGLSSTSNGRSNAWGRGVTAPGVGMNVDDLLRDMRLAPLLHLGVSYSF